MFLLRRKSDGKFWKNRSNPKYSYRPGIDTETHWADSEWTYHPSECKPFHTQAAAMQSRGVGWPDRQWHDTYHRCPPKEWRIAIAKWRAERFDVVPVKVKLEL